MRLSGAITGWIGIGILITVTLLFSSSYAQEATATAEPATTQGPLLTDELTTAVERGFAFLDERQNRDGSFGTDSRDRDAHVGVTAIAGLAYLAGGHLPGRLRRGDKRWGLSVWQRRGQETVVCVLSVAQ